MKELRQFGEDAENDRFPLIDVGGVILPGESATIDIQPGEGWNSAEGQGKQPDPKPDPQPDHGKDHRPRPHPVKPHTPSSAG